MKQAEILETEEPGATITVCVVNRRSTRFCSSYMEASRKPTGGLCLFKDRSHLFTGF
jgi:hypothetical protein